MSRSKPTSDPVPMNRAGRATRCPLRGSRSEMTLAPIARSSSPLPTCRCITRPHRFGYVIIGNGAAASEAVHALEEEEENDSSPASHEWSRKNMDRWI